MEMTWDKGSSVVLLCMENQNIHFTYDRTMAVMILCVIPFFPCGQTRWEDKNILYREAPQAKPKRTYKKRIKQGIFCSIYFNYFWYCIWLRLVHADDVPSIDMGNGPGEDHTNIDDIQRDVEGLGNFFDEVMLFWLNLSLSHIYFLIN